MISERRWLRDFSLITPRRLDTRLCITILSRSYSYIAPTLDPGRARAVCHAVDDENLSATTKLHFYDFFYRDAPTEVAVTTSDQSPAFNTVLTQLLLSNFNNRSIISVRCCRTLGPRLDQRIERSPDDLLGQWQQQRQRRHNGQGASTTNGTISLIASRWVRDIDIMISSLVRPGNPTHRPTGPLPWLTGIRQNLYLSGTAGIAITHTQGMGYKENFAGIALVEYSFHRGHLSIWGGQEPALVTAGGGLGKIRGVRGNLVYDITQRLTGSVGGAFENSSGTGFNADLASWGVGLNQRVNKYVNVYARFVQLRVTETSSNEDLIPTAFQNGKQAVGDYYILGFNVSFEAFRWSWQ